jgi:uncharacterized membrane protein/rhodanese-related sulfurtransferase
MAIGTDDTASAHGNHRVSISISAPVDLTYALWSDFKRLPEYLRHVLEVRIDHTHSQLQYWKTKVFGIEQEWLAEITSTIPNHLIAWKAVKGVENSGSLTFEGDAAQTQLTLQIGYDPPLGALGDLAEALWYKQRFDEALEEDLTRFKEIAEAEFSNSNSNSVPLTEAPEPAGYEKNYIPNQNVITATELKNRLQWGEVGFTLIDVRSADSYLQAHLQGANSVPFDMLEEGVLAITKSMSSPAERPLIVYSERGDGLSSKATALLERMGFDEVLNFIDGFSAAQSAKLPMEYQNTGQIDNKNLPERSDYIENVVSGPSLSDNTSN